MTAAKKDLRVEVRREDDGKVYSRIIDLAVDTGGASMTRVGDRQVYVTIDRVRGRGMDMETVMNRAQYIADLLGCPYLEDLTWPCSAAKGGTPCQCPACAAKANDRAKKK